jgi:hypothetical protein
MNERLADGAIGSSRAAAIRVLFVSIRPIFAPLPLYLLLKARSD